MAANDQMNRTVCDAYAFEEDDDYEMGRMAESRTDFFYYLFLRFSSLKGLRVDISPVPWWHIFPGTL